MKFNGNKLKALLDKEVSQKNLTRAGFCRELYKQYGVTLSGNHLGRLEKSMHIPGRPLREAICSYFDKEEKFFIEI